MRPPGTPSDAAEAASPPDDPIAAALTRLARDLDDEAVPDAAILAQVEAFADLFLQAETDEAPRADRSP